MGQRRLHRTAEVSPAGSWGQGRNQTPQEAPARRETRADGCSKVTTAAMWGINYREEVEAPVGG